MRPFETKEKSCGYCGLKTSMKNMARHMRRQHNIVANFVDSSDERIAMTPTSANQKAFSASTSDIRTATLCMIRRTDGCNLPQMNSYLATHFPQIPSDWRMPIIVATFTAVQKASAVHGDTLVGDDTERVQWSKRLLAQWAHGLSEIEPRRCADYLSETEPASRDSSLSSVGRKPMDGDLFKSRRLPVPLESHFARADAQKVFAQAVPLDTSITFPPEGGEDDVGADGVLVERASFDVDTLLESGVVSEDQTGQVRSSMLTTPIQNSPDGGPATSVTAARQMSESTCGPSAKMAPAIDTDALEQDNLLQPKEVATQNVPYSMPQTFEDLLLVEGVHTSLREQLLQPLSVSLTPLSSPKVESRLVSKRNPVESDIEPDDEPVLELHPSNASLYVEPVKAEKLHPTKLCLDEGRLSDNLPRVKDLTKPHASLVVKRRKKENTEPNQKNPTEFSKPTTTKAKEVQLDQPIKSEVHTVTEQKNKHRSDDRKPIHSLKSSSTGTKREREPNLRTVDGRETKRAYRFHHIINHRDERGHHYHRAQLPPPSYYLPPAPRFQQYHPW